MSSSLVLEPNQRQELLNLYRKHHDPEVRFRVHILLLLADGHTWETVASLLYCSSRTIDRWVKRFQEEGLDGLSGRRRGRPFRFRGRLGPPRRRLGPPLEPPRLRLAPQPLDLCLARPGLAGAIRCGRQPRDGPPLAPSRPDGLPPTPAGPGTQRRRAPVQAGGPAPAPRRTPRGRDGRLGGRGGPQYRPGDRPDVDAARPASHRPHAGDQPEALPRRLDPLADRPGLRHCGAEAEHGPVPGPSG